MPARQFWQRWSTPLTLLLYAASTIAFWVGDVRRTLRGERLGFLALLESVVMPMMLFSLLRRWREGEPSRSRKRDVVEGKVS